MLFKDPTLTQIMDEWSNTLFDDEEYEINEIEKELKEQYRDQGKIVEKRPKTKHSLQSTERLSKKDRKAVKCERCGHVWTPTVLNPKVCQKCLSYKWKVSKPEKVECKLCGHVWAPRTENPKWCGNCKNPFWNKEAYKRYKNFKIKNEKIILMHKGGNYEIETKTLETKEKLLSLMRQLLGKKWVTRKHLWCLVVFCEDKFGYNCYEQQMN